MTGPDALAAHRQGRPQPTEGIPDQALPDQALPADPSAPVPGTSQRAAADARRPGVDGALPDWRLSERLAWVRRFRRGVVRAMGELADAALREVHKPRFETLVSDLVPLLSSCRWHERHAAGVLRRRRLVGQSLWQLGQRHHVQRMPLGRVGIIATWNYPVQLLGVQLVQALVAGNRVVVKPSERCPGVHGRLLAIAQDAGLPEGALAVLEATRRAGAAMVEREPLDHLVFTGSTAVGRTIAQTLGGRLVPSTLELSGQDSALVLADADVALAARAIAAAVRLNAGQTCMAPRRVLVEAGVAGAFMDRLDAHLAQAGPLRLCDGSACRPRAVRCEPDDPLVLGERFEPTLAVVACPSLEAMLSLHQGLGPHLATSIYTRRIDRALGLIERMQAGTVTINDSVIPTAHPGAPLPARGESGWGVSRGELGLLAMTRPVHVSTTRRRLRLPTDEPPPEQARRLWALVRWWYGR